MLEKNESKPKAPTETPRARPHALGARKSSNADNDARAPVTREEVKDNLRDIIRDIVSHIVIAGPNNAAVSAFLGVTVNQSSFVEPFIIKSELIQLEHFTINAIIDKAYDFAYQIGPRSHQYAMEDGDVQQILTVRHASPGGVWGVTGPESIADINDSPLCRTIDTAHARWEHKYGEKLTVRQLALLANMTEPAVRTSLSKEGIRTTEDRDKDSGLTTISAEDCRRWLKGRRGFIPTLMPEPTDPSYTDDIVRLFRAHNFSAGLDGCGWRGSLSTTAHEAEVDPNWLLEVATGRPAKLDIDALRRLSEYLFANSPVFVGGLVERILRANQEIE